MTDQVTTAPSAATPHAPTAPALRATTGVALLACCAALVFGVRWQRAGEDLGPTQRHILDDARAAVTALTTLDGASVETSTERWENVTTGPLHDAVSQGRSDFQALLAGGGASTSGTVKEAAVADYNARAGTAVVLAALDVVTTPRQGEKQTERLRVVVTMTRTEGTWKASELRTVNPS